MADKTTEEAKPSTKPNKHLVSLEEDDEFEDFPVEDWPDADTDIAIAGGKEHLWEEQWDDDDAEDDFANRLREELKKSGNSMTE